MSTIKVNKITSVNGTDSVEVDTHIKLKEQSATPTSTSHGALYVDTGGALKYQNGAINSGSPVTISSTGVALDSANTFTEAQLIDGTTNGAVQLKVQGAGGQSVNIFEITTSGDSDLFTVNNSGDVGITNDLTLNTDSSVFNMGAGSDFSITHDGTTGATLAGTPITIQSTGDFTIDGSADIILDAGGGDVKLKDDGADFGSLTNTSGNLIIKSGTTTAATFNGANVTLAGTVACGEITVANGSGINLQEDITFTGATTENKINMPASLADALSIKQSSTSYMKFATDTPLITFGQDVNMDGKTLDNAELQSYKEEIETVSQGSATVTLDMNDANIFYTVLTENCTAIQFDNMVAGHSATWIVKNGASSTAYDVTFATVKIGSGGSDIGKFPSGEEPQWTDTAQAIDVFTFFCLDTNHILVMTGGLDFKA